MIKYEYKKLETYPGEFFNESIEVIGQKGWELVSVAQHKDRDVNIHILYFKRPIEESNNYKINTLPLSTTDFECKMFKKEEKLYTRDEVVKMLNDLYKEFPPSDDDEYLWKIIQNKIKSL